VFKSNHVIGVMFYGNSHTTNPQWLNQFGTREYKIFSFNLLASKEICFQRCLNDSNTGHHPINKDKAMIYKYHDDFYKREKESPFSVIVGIYEIKIKTEGKSQI
jgi:hypothetical protein